MTPQTVATLVKAIEAKDASTAAHTWRVVLYTRAMAEAAHVDRDRIALITTAAALHDIGKLNIPSSVLKKPGKLTDEEFEVIKTHTTIGHSRLIEEGMNDPLILDIVRHHHERWDGKGYPDGLAGQQIPRLATFFAVIDSFDALTSIRPYRREIGKDAAEKAVAELKSGIGTRYAPEAVELFEKLYRTGELNWILGYYNDECPIPEFEGRTHIIPTVAPATGTPATGAPLHTP